jgi:hypothetical protein
MLEPSVLRDATEALLPIGPPESPLVKRVSNARSPTSHRRENEAG